MVLTQKEFVTRTGGLLRGLWWKYESHEIWADGKDVLKGYVDLPGAPAPEEYESSEAESEEVSICILPIGLMY